MIDRYRRKDLTVRMRHKDAGLRTDDRAAKRGERRETNASLSKIAWDDLDALVESL